MGGRWPVCTARVVYRAKCFTGRILQLPSAGSFRMTSSNWEGNNCFPTDVVIVRGADSMRGYNGGRFRTVSCDDLAAHA